LYDTRKQEENWEIEEDTRVIGKENTLSELPDDEYAKKELISELPDDEYAKKELIFKIIEDNKYHYPEKIKSTNCFRIPDGKLVTTEKDNSILVGEGIGDFVIESELENEYDSTIKDIKIVDQIPYCFKINKIDIHGKMNFWKLFGTYQNLPQNKNFKQNITLGGELIEQFSK